MFWSDDHSGFIFGRKCHDVGTSYESFNQIIFSFGYEKTFKNH